MACLRAASTPKSPQPGHQSGSTLPLRSLIVSLGRSALPSLRAVASRSTMAMAVSLHLHLVHGHVVLLAGAGQDGGDAIDDMVRHERLPIVFADVAVGHDAGLRPQ